MKQGNLLKWKNIQRHKRPAIFRRVSYTNSKVNGHTWHSNHFCLSWPKQDVRVMRQTQHNLGENCVIWMTEELRVYRICAELWREALWALICEGHESSSAPAGWLASPRRLRRGERESDCFIAVAPHVLGTLPTVRWASRLFLSFS